MTRSTLAPLRPPAGILVLALVASLTGCDRDVVASAGKTRITRADLEAYLSRRGGPSGADPEAAISELGPRALLAEAGRRAGLEDDPAVKARLAASRREILAQAYLDREVAKADGEDALRARYAAEKDALTRRRVHVAHAAFLPKGQDEAARGAARSRATRAYARLVGGEAFEKVAKELSEDPATAPKGGDLGPLLDGEVDKAFFEAAAALKQGEFSQPVETAYGFHVLKALEPMERVTPTFDEVRGRLAAEARSDAQAALVEKLRKDIGLDVHPERIKSVSRPQPKRHGEGT